MKLLTLLLIGTGLYASSGLAASQTSGLPNCVVCHGSGLQGNVAVKAPNLSILPIWYISAQLDAYQQKWRGIDASLIDAIDMHAVAITLTDKERAQALTFIATKPALASSPKLSADTDHGKQLFSTCSGCHGNRAQGNEALKAPPLAGQNDWYIVSQLKAYQANHRGYAKEDSNGNMMRSSANLLANEQDIVDVASYLNSITIPKE